MTDACRGPITGDNDAVTTFYDEIGGEETITAIVAAFYRGVAGDEVLRPLYPEEDLGPAEERFRTFLMQYWGGPTTYSDRRGHPRLRMRHAPFAVTPVAKEHWLTHFRAALDEVGLPPEQDAQFWDYVTHAAQFMVNSFE
ncbi:MAG: hemoglobin [Nocardioidaceae bacterium]|nr:hemoglobin [Nocardioidaceae bacterium]